jgi:hypothetical protein
MKIRPVAAEFFPCGRTDKRIAGMTKIVVADRNLGTRPKIKIYRNKSQELNTSPADIQTIR